MSSVAGDKEAKKKKTSSKVECRLFLVHI